MKVNQRLILSLLPLTIAATALVAQLPISAARANDVMQMSLPAQKAAAMKTGNFMTAEKPTTGTARIVTENGHRFLELSNTFSTSDQGPDLHVLLDNSNRPAQSYQNLNSFVNLGKLRSFSGAQRYPIPDAVNITNVKSVVIWCRMANATFGYAPLK